MITIHRGSDILLDVGVNQGSIRRFNLMKEDFIRLKFSLTTNTPLLIGDYVDLTGYINSCDNENFRIKNSIADQTTKKFVLDRNYYPTFNKDTGGWDYNVQINAYYHQWKNKIFMFNPSKGAAESSFSLTDTIDKHVELVVKNLASAELRWDANTEYSASVQKEAQTKGMKPITYSAVSIYGALDMIAQAFECEWWLDGCSTIYFGYRKGDESITLTLNEEIVDTSISDSDGVHATRIYAFGGTTNVPTHYRDKLVFEVNSYWVENGTIKGVRDSRKPVLSSYFRGDKGKADSRLLTIREATSSKGEFTSEEQTPDIAAVTSTRVVSIEAQTYDIDLSELTINFKTTHIIGAETEATNLIEVGKDIDIRASVVATDGTNEDVIASEVKNIKIDRGTPTTSVAFTNSQRKFSFVPSSIEIRVEVISAKWTYTKHMGNENLVDGKWYDCKLVDFEFSNEQAVISFQKSAQSAETIIRINGGTKDYTAIINPNYEDGGSDILITDYTGAWEGIKTYTFPNIVISRVPSQYFSQEEGGVQNGVVQKNLMLPIGTNYVQADGVADANVVEAIMVYDWIYPKTALKVAKVEPFNEWEVEIEDGQKIYTTTYDITLPIEDYEDDLWVDPSQMFAIFQSGKAAGLRFELNYIKQTKNDVTFRLVPNEDYSITVPNEATIPAIDDEIILEGIDVSFLSGSAITYAENELLAQANKDILETSKEDKVVDITLTSTDAYNRGRIALGTLTKLVGVLSSEDGAYDSRVLGFEECLDIPWDKPKYIIGDRNYYNRQASIESKLENIEKGSITLSGVNIGGGGSNIPIIKVKDSTKPTDANVYSALRSREEFAKRKEEETFSEKVTFNKDIDVKGATKTKSLSVSNDANIGGNQTIQGTQEVGGLQTLKGGFQTPNFNNAAGQITGAHLTPDGMLYVAGLKANNFEVEELTFNVVKAQGGEFVYSTAAEIASCAYMMRDGSYLSPSEFYALPNHDWQDILYVDITLKEDELTGKGNPFEAGDIIYGKVNKIQESGKHAVGGQCVMYITEIGEGLDIKAKLYQVGEYGIVANIPPIEDMVIAHRGNKDGKEGRTTSFYLSTIDGNLVMLYNVTTPTLSAENYGATFGKLPYDLLLEVKKYYAGITEHDPVTYAKYGIFENLIQFDHLGQPIRYEVYRGAWRYDVAASDKPYVETATTYDTVTHNGAKWRIRTSNTTKEPSHEYGDWELLTDTNLTLFELQPSSNIIYRRDGGVIRPDSLDIQVKQTTAAGSIILDDQAELVAKNLTVWYSIDGSEERHMLVIGGTKVFVAEDGETEFATEDVEEAAYNSSIYIESESIDLANVADNITLYLVEGYPNNPTDKASYVIPVVVDGAAPLGLEVTPSALSVPVDATTGNTAGVKEIEATVRLKQGLSYVSDLTGYNMTLTFTMRNGDTSDRPPLTYYEEIDTDTARDGEGNVIGWKIIVKTKNDIAPSNLLERINITINHEETPVATAAIPFTYLERGIAGPMGKDGPMLFPCGTWREGTEYSMVYLKTKDDNGNEVIATDEDGKKIILAKPFVYYKNVNNDEYYVLNDDVPAGSNIQLSNTQYWKPFTKIQYIFTEALMAEWGQLASAVFNGDYMFSVDGIDKDGHVSDYSKHQEDGLPMFDHNESGDKKRLNGNFVPNLFFDFATGASKMNKVSEPFNQAENLVDDGGSNIYKIDLYNGHNVTVQQAPYMVCMPNPTNVLNEDGSVNESIEWDTDGVRSCIIVQPNFEYQRLKADGSLDWDGKNGGYAIGDYLTILCADGRIMNAASYKDGDYKPQNELEFVSSTTSDVKTGQGYFVINGQLSKFLVLEPSAIVTLRSCRTKMGTEEATYWYVENQSDFERVKLNIDVFPDTSSVSFTCEYDGAGNSSEYGKEVAFGSKYLRALLDAKGSFANVGALNYEVNIASNTIE